MPLANKLVLVLSNQPRATRSPDLKSLARLLLELYSTQSYDHYYLSSHTNSSMQEFK